MIDVALNSNVFYSFRRCNQLINIEHSHDNENLILLVGDDNHLQRVAVFDSEEQATRFVWMLNKWLFQ